jgi:hypothetical protein
MHSARHAHSMARGVLPNERLMAHTFHSDCLRRRWADRESLLDRDTAVNARRIERIREEHTNSRRAGLGALKSQLPGRALGLGRESWLTRIHVCRCVFALNPALAGRVRLTCRGALTPLQLPVAAAAFMGQVAPRRRSGPSRRPRPTGRGGIGTAAFLRARFRTGGTSCGLLTAGVGALGRTSSTVSLGRTAPAVCRRGGRRGLRAGARPVHIAGHQRRRGDQTNDDCYSPNRTFGQIHAHGYSPYSFGQVVNRGAVRRPLRPFLLYQEILCPPDSCSQRSVFCRADSVQYPLQGADNTAGRMPPKILLTASGRRFILLRLMIGRTKAPVGAAHEQCKNRRGRDPVR